MISAFRHFQLGASTIIWDMGWKYTNTQYFPRGVMLDIPGDPPRVQINWESLGVLEVAWVQLVFFRASILKT